MLGRGTRPTEVMSGLSRDERRERIAASKKPHMILIDFVDNTEKHDLMSMSRALGLKRTKDLRGLPLSEIVKLVEHVSGPSIVRSSLTGWVSSSSSQRRVLTVVHPCVSRWPSTGPPTASNRRGT
jgi:hypothetical protein